MSSSVYIYLEINGKKYKSDKAKHSYYKLILNDIGISDEKKEINCIIVDNIELNFLIRNINKGTRKKSNTIHKKSSKSLSSRGKMPRKPIIPVVIKQGVFTKPRISPSIRDKMKIYSGELRKKKLKIKVFPGKIKKLTLFKNTNTINLKEEDEKNNNIKEKISKEKIPKEKVIKDKILKEKVIKEKIPKEKIIKDRIPKEKGIKEKGIKEKVIKDKVTKEKVTKVKSVREKYMKNKIKHK